MSGSYSKWTVLGNLGADPEIRTQQSGKQIAKFSVATTLIWKDKEGKKQSRTQWVPVVVFNQSLIANVIKPYLKRGMKVLVEGSPETRKWQDTRYSDIEHQRTEITIRPFDGQITLVSSAKDNMAPASSTPTYTQENAQPCPDDFSEDEIKW